MVQWRIVPSFITFLAIGGKRVVFVLFVMAASATADGGSTCDRLRRGRCQLREPTHLRRHDLARRPPDRHDRDGRTPVTGLGATNPPASSDAGGVAVPPFNEIDRSQLKVFMGETAADVLWAGLMPGYPGIYMLNVKANGAISTRVYVQQSGLQSNITDVDPFGSDYVSRHAVTRLHSTGCLLRRTL